MNKLITHYYYTLNDILVFTKLTTNNTFTELLNKATTYTLSDTAIAQTLYNDYIVPHTLYDNWVITNEPLKLLNNKIDNIEVKDLFNRIVSKLNSLIATYGALISQYSKDIDELIKSGTALSTSKAYRNDTPESSQLDKFDDKYASETTTQQTTITDDSGALIDKLNNYRDKIDNIYEMLYEEFEKMIVGDIYEV